MGNSFYKLTVHINQLNKLILDKIQTLLLENKFYDLNANQALVLSNIGKDPRHVHATNKSGYYLGTNISYNVGVLVKTGYIERINDNKDKRCAFLVLTEKGKQVLDLMEKDNVSHEKLLQKMKIDGNNINEILVRLQAMF